MRACPDPLDPPEVLIGISDPVIGECPPTRWIPQPPKSRTRQHLQPVPQVVDAESVQRPDDPARRLDELSFDDIASNTFSAKRQLHASRYEPVVPISSDPLDWYRERMQLPHSMSEDDKAAVRRSRHDGVARIPFRDVVQSVRVVEPWHASPKVPAPPLSATPATAPYRSPDVEGPVATLRRKTQRAMLSSAPAPAAADDSGALGPLGLSFTAVYGACDDPDGNPQTTTPSAARRRNIRENQLNLAIPSVSQKPAATKVVDVRTYFQLNKQQTSETATRHSSHQTFHTARAVTARERNRLYREQLARRYSEENRQRADRVRSLHRRSVSRTSLNMSIASTVMLAGSRFLNGSRRSRGHTRLSHQSSSISAVSVTTRRGETSSVIPLSPKALSQSGAYGSLQESAATPVRNARSPMLVAQKAHGSLLEPRASTYRRGGTAPSPTFESQDIEEAQQEVELRRVNTVIDGINARRKRALSIPNKKPLRLDAQTLSDDEFLWLEDDFMRATGRTDRIIRSSDFANSTMFREFADTSLSTAKRRERCIIVGGITVTESKFSLMRRSDAPDGATSMYHFFQKLFREISAARLEELFVRNCAMINRELPLHIRYDAETLAKMELIFFHYADSETKLVSLSVLEAQCSNKLSAEILASSLRYCLKGVIPAPPTTTSLSPLRDQATVIVQCSSPASPRAKSTARIVESETRDGSVAGSPVASFMWHRPRRQQSASTPHQPYPVLRHDGLPQSLNFEDFIFCMKLSFPPFSVL